MWIILLLISLFIGYLTISFWRKDFSNIEKLALSFCLGIGETSIIMFLIGVVNIPLTANNILISLIIFCFLLFLLSIIFTGNIFRFKRPKIGKIYIYEWPFILLIIFLAVWVFIQTVSWPPFAWDTLALYDFRAKVIAEKFSLAQEFFTSQPNVTAYNYVYPFSTSLMHALIYIGGGSNPQFLYSLYYVSLILLMYSLLRRILPRFPSLVMTAVLGSTPEILFPSTIAYPNIPYALYFAFSTLYFWEWIRHRKIGFLVVSALLLGISVWIRNSEPFWAVNLFFISIFLLWKRKILYLILYLALFLPLRQLWPTYQQYVFSQQSDIFFSPPQAFYLDLLKIPEVIFFVLKYFIQDWVVYLFVLFFSVLFVWRKEKKYKLLIIWLLGYVALSVAGTYYFAVSFDWWNQVGGSAKRVSVFFAPLIIYAISLFLMELLKGVKPHVKNATLSLNVHDKKLLIFKWPQ